MTAESVELPWDVLGKVTTRIVNEVKGVNRVFYDCTGKPSVLQNLNNLTNGKLSYQ